MSRSDDHVFPTSWFPDSTSGTVQRWTVPSHRKCNNELGAIEKDVFVRLAMCADRRKVEAFGIGEKALRSLDPGAPGITHRERVHRWVQSEKLWKDIARLNSTTLPGSDGKLIDISADDLYDVAAKIIRGCEYKLGAERIIEPPYALLIQFVREKKLPEEIEQFWAEVIPVNLGPGFQIWRETCEDDPLVVLYRISIWDTVRFFAVVGQQDELEHLV